MPNNMETERSDEFVVTLQGPGVEDGRISLSALSLLAESLQRALIRATMALEGKPSSRGRPGSRFVRAASLDLTGIGPGSIKLRLAPSEPRLSPDMSALPDALGTIVAGLQVVTEKGDAGASWPRGFTLEVIDALMPLEQLYIHHGVEALGLDVSVGKAVSVSVRKPDWAALHRVGQAQRSSGIRSVVGRLLVADLKNHKCKVYDASGAHLIAFKASQDGAVKQGLQGWVRAEWGAEGLETSAEASLTFLSEDEADAVAPPRLTPWPHRVLDILHAEARHASATMTERPQLPAYELDD